MSRVSRQKHQMCRASSIRIRHKITLRKKKKTIITKSPDEIASKGNAISRAKFDETGRRLIVVRNPNRDRFAGHTVSTCIHIHSVTPGIFMHGTCMQRHTHTHVRKERYKLVTHACMRIRVADRRHRVACVCVCVCERARSVTPACASCSRRATYATCACVTAINWAYACACAQASFSSLRR